MLQVNCCYFVVLEHGSPKHKELALSHLLMGLLEFATSEQGFKSVAKALKEGGRDALNKFVDRMRESPAGLVMIRIYLIISNYTLTLVEVGVGL